MRLRRWRETPKAGIPAVIVYALKRCACYEAAGWKRYVWREGENADIGRRGSTATGEQDGYGWRIESDSAHMVCQTR